MSTTSKAGDVVATLFFMSSFFSMGAAVFEGQVNYPAWLRISDQSFIAYHQAIGARIGFLIVPLVLATVFNILLLWRRPASIPLWAVWSTLALQGAMWVSTVAIQVPIQFRLGAQGYSSELLHRLIWTDLLYRKLPGYARLAITGWMLYRVVIAASPARRGTGAAPLPPARGPAPTGGDRRG